MAFWLERSFIRELRLVRRPCASPVSPQSSTLRWRISNFAWIASTIFFSLETHRFSKVLLSFSLFFSFLGYYFSRRFEASTLLVHCRSNDATRNFSHSWNIVWNFFRKHSSSWITRRLVILIFLELSCCGKRAMRSASILILSKTLCPIFYQLCTIVFILEICILLSNTPSNKLIEKKVGEKMLGGIETVSKKFFTGWEYISRR